MLLPDWMIRRDISIEPFSEGCSEPGKVSWGLQPCGYDLRLGRKFRVFRPVWDGWGQRYVDPCDFPADMAPEEEGDQLIIPPHGFALAESVEYIKLPRNVLGLVLDKSSLRRCGILMGATVGEPGWEGRYTLEISNATPLAVRLRAGSGIAQVIFFRAEGYPLADYGQKGGRYQSQHGLTLPHVRNALEASQMDDLGSRPIS